MRSAWILRPASAVGLLAIAVACGPSFAVIYESDVHFEHCYALDDTNIAADLKRACWGQWLSTYAYGQPRDRLEYAAHRAGLAPAPPARAAPPLPAAPVGSTAAAAPVPTNAFQPPPAVASSLASATATPAFSAPLPPATAPGRACTDGCESSWKGCRAACAADACVRCDHVYRACVPACFR